MKRKIKISDLIPISLIICPYLFFLFPIFLDNDMAIYIYFYIILAIIVNCINIVYSCTRKKEDYYKLAFYNMIIKLSHILFYISIFCIAMISAIISVVPVFIAFGISVIIGFVIIDYCLMLTSSAYGINALIRARKNENIGKYFFIVNTILHFVFVMDVISSIIVFFKIEKIKDE